MTTTKTPDIPRALKGIEAFIAGLGLVPVATLRTPGAIGDLALNVTSATDAARFISDTPLTFLDGLEQMQLVGQVNGGAITLDMSGRPPGFSGLQAAHAAGSQIACNLFRTPLGDVTEAFANTFPLISVYILDRSGTQRSAAGPNTVWWNRGILSVHYQLPAKQPDGYVLHSQIWLEQMLDRGDTDCDTLIKAIEDNPVLGVAGVATVYDVTAYTESRRHNISDPKKPVFEFFAEFHIQMLPRSANT